MSNSRKGMSRALIFLGLIAVVGVVVVPKLPQYMMAAGITGEATAGAVEPLQVGNPSLEDIDLGTDGLSYEMAIPVENPNPFPAAVDKITYTTEIDGEEVGEGTIEKRNSIPPNSEAELTDTVQVDLTESLSAGIGSMIDSFTGETTYLVVDGEIHTTIGPVSTSTPFEEKTAIN